MNRPLSLLPGLVLILASATVFAQEPKLLNLDEEVKTNIRLLPKYGLVKKSDNLKALDAKFIESTMADAKFNGNRRAASDHFIQLGFNYLYRGDPRTAMYRFNQAYLLDSTNTDIYWGYGAFYMTMSKFQDAKAQYEEGLSIDPKNTHLLTDYGTYFMSQYSYLENTFEKDAKDNLEKAISHLTKSFELDPKDQNTSFKLSVCYLIKKDCDKAWKFYEICKELGGQPITVEYTRDLEKACKK